MLDQNHILAVDELRGRLARIKAEAAELENDPIGVERRKHAAEWNLHRRTDLARPEEMTDAVCAEIAAISLRTLRETLVELAEETGELRPLTDEEEAWLLHEKSPEGAKQRQEARRDTARRMQKDGVGEYERNF